VERGEGRARRLTNKMLTCLDAGSQVVRGGAIEGDGRGEVVELVVEVNSHGGIDGGLLLQGIGGEGSCHGTARRESCNVGILVHKDDSDVSRGFICTN
jgi:hypothetical protein